MTKKINKKKNEEMKERRGHQNGITKYDLNQMDC